jgi:predicted lipoprotein with Yx(FWY)xxD motif
MRTFLLPSVSLSISGVLITALVSGCGTGNASGQSTSDLHVPLPSASTPTGVMLIDVTRELPASQPEYLWTRLADDKGNTLLIFARDTQPGVSNCTGECAKEFPPFIAPAGAKAFGEWSVVAREGGQLQWAYQGKPLYRFSKETRVGEVVDSIVLEGSKKTKLAQRADDATKPHLMPPPDWSVARFDPGAHLPRPPGIAVRPVTVETGTGVGLVDSKGMTLYGYDGAVSAAVDAECDGSKDCRTRFLPVLAPSLATTTLGEFSTVERKADRARQWAYRGVPLYTFSGDLKPGDTNGVYGKENRWQVLLLTIDPFPKDVQYIRAPVKGQILATSNGAPLYMRARFEDRWGGFTTYQGYSNAYRMGRMVNTQGCDAECLKTRRPLQAPPDARPAGFWDVYTRPDGSKQWAYKGFALYSYLGDTRPGIVTGSNITDYVIADNGPYTLAEAR